ncbi:lactonase family protein [Fluviicola taffensis]|uniref:lactonase family protein n=1 Tax=Fluviicola taffensis TaxID=191579 RepID=UPI0031380475
MNKTLAFLFFALVNFAFSQSTKTVLFVGTFTGDKPDSGIYIYEFNASTGNLTPVSHGSNITNPSFLTISPNGNYIYACTDTKMPDAGSVSAFRFDSISGSLTFLNKQPSGGENPVYVTTSKNNEFVINANYTAGSVSVFSTNTDGSLNPFSQLIPFKGSSINTRRQEKAHIHATVFSPDFNYLFFPDLGSDKIHVFEFDPTKKQPLKASEQLDFVAIPGSGPRHFTFHPTKPVAYCMEELSGMVSAFQVENGKLDSIQRIFSYSKLQEDYNSADIHISPDGLFLYASNRWDHENTLSIFSIDQRNGTLTLVGHQSTLGDNPRNFVIDPTGNFLIVANQVSNNLIVFKRDLKTGLLTKTQTEITVKNPSCLQMRIYGQ